jgi:hypothetical protein
MSRFSITSGDNETGFTSLNISVDLEYNNKTGLCFSIEDDAKQEDPSFALILISVEEARTIAKIIDLLADEAERENQERSQP